MKKIISAVALASLALGVATADAKITLNYRTQAVGFSRLIDAPNTNGVAASPENENYWFQQKAYGTASDTVKFAVSSDFGGAVVRIDPKATDGSETLQDLQGYVKLGAFEIGAGTWKDGMFNGAYQLKNDSDNGNYGGETFAAYKLGSMFAKSVTTQIDDIANLNANSSTSTGYAKWAGDLGDYEVTATGTLIGLKGSTWDSASTIYSGFGLKLDIKGSVFDTQFVFKTGSNDSSKTVEKVTGEQRAFGLHTQAKGLIPSTTFTLGGAAGFVDGALTEINFDARARYASGPLSITFLNNISHITNDNTYSRGLGLAKQVGAIYTDASSDSDGKLRSAATYTSLKTAKTTDQQYFTVMWNMLGMRYNVNNNFALLFSAGDIVYLNDIGYAFADSDSGHYRDWLGMEVFAAPGLQLTAGKGATVSTYFRFGWTGVGAQENCGDEKYFAFLVPVVVRVKM